MKKTIPTGQYTLSGHLKDLLPQVLDQELLEHLLSIYKVFGDVEITLTQDAHKKVKDKKDFIQEALF